MAMIAQIEIVEFLRGLMGSDISILTMIALMVTVYTIGKVVVTVSGTQKSAMSMQVETAAMLMKVSKSIDENAKNEREADQIIISELKAIGDEGRRGFDASIEMARAASEALRMVIERQAEQQAAEQAFFDSARTTLDNIASGNQQIAASIETIREDLSGKLNALSDHVSKAIEHARKERDEKDAKLVSMLELINTEIAGIGRVVRGESESSLSGM